MGLYIVRSVCLVVLHIFLYNKMTEAAPKYKHEEQIAILKFRELVKDDLYRNYMKSDPYLIRWLRTRNFNEKEAAFMLRKAMQWRKDNNIDDIVDEVIFDGLPPFFTDGIDNEGSVVATYLMSRFDTRTFVEAGKRNVPIRYFSQLCEQVEQKVYQNLGVIGNKTLEGNATELGVIIFNLKGYSLRNHACVTCFSVYLEWFEILENYYPGYIKHIFYVDTPKIFAPLLQLLKPLMSPMTRNALKVYGQNKAKWQSAIIGKIIPHDQVRSLFGGTRPD